MFINHNGRYYLLGIVSYGRSECDGKLKTSWIIIKKLFALGHGIYTNIYEFLSWINETIENN